MLDWSKGDIAYQVGYADIVLSKNLAKYLVVEVKRPGTLWPRRQALQFCFCGNEPVKGLPYCPGHARIAYRSVGRQRSSARA